LVALHGHDFYQKVTAGWNTAFTAVSARSTLEGSDGVPISTLGGMGTGGSGGQFETSVKLIGNSSAYFRSNTAGQTCSGPGIGQDYNTIYLDPQFNGGTGDLWVRLHVRWHRRTDTLDRWPNGYMKVFELWNATFYFNTDQTRRSRANPSRFRTAVAGSANSVAFNSPEGAIAQDQWYTLEVHHNNTRGATHREIFIYGASVLSDTPAHSETNTQGLQIGTINACGTEPWDVETYFDEIAVATERIFPASEIWLCDESTFASATCVAQPPTTISDTEIIFAFRKTGITKTGTNRTIPRGTRFIFVRNQRRQVSAGMAVTVP
jgi:hypothetical protein